MRRVKLEHLYGIEKVKKVFSTFEVPQNSPLPLIMSTLSYRMRYLFASLCLEQVADYEKGKADVLEELRRTPGEFRFESASKQQDEGWTWSHRG